MMVGGIFLGHQPGIGQFVEAASSNPMENVFTGSGDCSAMDATTELESMPPLRNAPSGTSAIMRMRTASSNFSRTRITASACVKPGAGSATGAGSCQ